MAKASNPPQHNDLLGQPLEVGDIVVCPGKYNGTMMVAKITSLGKVKVRCRPLLEEERENIHKLYSAHRFNENIYQTLLRYPEHLAKIHSQDITMYLLKNGGK